MTRDEMISFHKAVLWEEAKGKLRAVTAVQGQTVGDPEAKFEIVEATVEGFIKEFEANGLHE